MTSLYFQTNPNVNLKPCLGPRAIPIARSTSRFSSLSIKCGLRHGSRKPLWRTIPLSKEAMTAVQGLKLAKSTHKLPDVLTTRLPRLLKVDLFSVLSELQRQNELDLSLKVFNFIVEEIGHDKEQSLYCDMILLLARHTNIKMAQGFFGEIMRKGLKPDTRTYTEMIGAYTLSYMTDNAMEMYQLMKASGCVPDKLTFAILFRYLEEVGEQELLATVKAECADLLDFPDKFFQKVEQGRAKRRNLSPARKFPVLGG